MKNNYNIIVAAAIILTASACVQEAGNESPMDCARRYELSFAPFTKTEISGVGTSRSVSWNEGDIIQYYTEPGQSEPAEAAVRLIGGKAYVDIPRGSTDQFINAVYGAKTLKSSSSAGNCMYIRSNRVLGGFNILLSFTSFSAVHVCAAFSDDLDNPVLNFHNAVCVVKFTSAPGVDEVVFSGNADEIISGGMNGDLKISPSAGALTVESTATGINAYQQTLVRIKTNGKASDFYFAILPVCFNEGITVKCYDSAGGLMFTKKTSSPLSTVSDSGAVKILDLGNVEDWIVSAATESVDLGLSVKWGRVNLGATKQEEYGDYFAWGETGPKAEYKWTNYTFEQGTSRNGPFSKYVIDSDWGTVDHKTVLDLEDDPAHATLGGDWRMPTEEEFEELMNNCYWSWTTHNGIPGYCVTRNKSDYSNGYIFLPANGKFENSSVSKRRTEGYYWSTSLSFDKPYNAVSQTFSKSNNNSGNIYRYIGLGIRPVEGAIVPVSSIEIPASFDLKIWRSALLAATVYPENATYKNLTWASSDESIVAVDNKGMVTAVSSGKATITAYSADASKSASCEVTVVVPPMINNHEYVDLGLPSGLKWAICNVGATEAEEYGDYFAWGETETKSDYSWATYKWCKGDMKKIIKYCDYVGYGWDGSGSPDNKIVLDPEDDVAHVTWGGSWRIPTRAEYKELINNCTLTWTDNFNGTGIAGRVVTAVNGNSIFFPAAGCRYGEELGKVGSVISYSSSSLNADYHYSFSAFCFDYDAINEDRVSFADYRCYGYSVRPVSE